MDEELENQTDVIDQNEQDPLPVEEVVEINPEVVEVDNVYDFENFSDICTGELLVNEVIACYEYEQKETLDYMSDSMFVGLNIIVGVLIGYILIKGLFEPWNH